jgi:hypothetical protein
MNFIGRYHRHLPLFMRQLESRFLQQVQRLTRLTAQAESVCKLVPRAMAAYVSRCCITSCMLRLQVADIIVALFVFRDPEVSSLAL